MIRKRTIIADYHKVFESPEGSRVLKDLAKHCPLLTESISTAGGIDVNKLLYLEGQRSVLLYIYKMMKRDPNEETQSKAINQ